MVNFFFEFVLNLTMVWKDILYQVLKRMCISRKYPCLPPPQKVNENSKRSGVAKAKVFKEKHGAKLGFPECVWGGGGGGGVQTKKTFCGGYGYFLEAHNISADIQNLNTKT